MLIHIRNRSASRFEPTFIEVKIHYLMILRKIFISYLLNLKGFLSWMGDGQFSNISTLLIGRMKWGMFKYLMLEV